MAHRLTDDFVLDIVPTASRTEFFDGSGLGIRVTPKGTKSWVFVYHFGGKSRRMTLGRFPTMTAAKARLAHAQAMIALEEGRDPGARVAELRARPLVRDLVEIYVDRYARPRKRSWREDQRLLGKYVVPRIGTMKIDTVRRRDVVALLDAVVDAGAPVSANRVLAVTRKMFNFAISRDLLEASPCAQVKPPTKERSRDRTLKPDEIFTLWNRLDDCSMSRGTHIAIKLLILTAQRSGEVVRAPWSEFDLDAGWWTVEADRSKNGKAHRVPLSQPVRQLLRQAKLIASHSQWVFPSPNANAPMTTAALGRALRRSANALGIEHFVPHDLRRTAASGMASIGVDRLVISKILNHTDRSVTAVYDQHSYDREKREALDAWARTVETLSSEPPTQLTDASSVHLTCPGEEC